MASSAKNNFSGTQAVDLSYLAHVREAVPPLTERLPIWMRHGRVVEGPPAASPQRHPCYEIGIQLAGAGLELVGGEQAHRGPGDLLLAAPGVPHWIEITKYPLEFITVFFLPSLLIDLGPEGDGLKILRRFTSSQDIRHRLVHPSPALRLFLKKRFTEMVEEFEHGQFGREVRLRTLLLEILVRLIRWEHKTGRPNVLDETPVDWGQVHVALEFLRAHYSESIYAADVADAVGVTDSQLKRLFRTALGMPWGKYLQSYRIHRAATLLGESGCGILEASLAVGFETISHFNATFREFMGASPSEYRRKISSDSVGAKPTKVRVQPSRTKSPRIPKTGGVSSKSGSSKRDP